MNDFKLDSITPCYRDADQSTRNVSTSIAEDLRHSRRVKTRTFKELLRVANAAKVLDKLPRRNESIHIVCKGNFAAWDFVPAVLRLAEPHTIRRLDVATLGFNTKGVAELSRLMDAGTIAAVSFVYSCYFRDSSSNESDFLCEQLIPRGAKVAAVRSHAKLLLMELTSDQYIVIESSANLRSCHNIEQYVISNDRELLQFHRAWIAAVIAEAQT